MNRLSAGGLAGLLWGLLFAAGGLAASVSVQDGAQFVDAVRQFSSTGGDLDVSLASNLVSVANVSFGVMGPFFPGTLTWDGSSASSGAAVLDTAMKSNLLPTFNNSNHLRLQARIPGLHAPCYYAVPHTHSVCGLLMSTNLPLAPHVLAEPDPDQPMRCHYHMEPNSAHIGEYCEQHVPLS